MKKQANAFRDMAHKYKRNFGKAEREQRKALFDEAHKILKEVGNSEQYIIDDLLAKAQVITATLVGANHYTVRQLKYHTVVIDEAGQALEPACWIPILKAQKVVLAGDHCQLPPTIKSQEAARKGLSITLLEKCVQLHPEAVTLLQEQYRMNEMIMGYPSAVFYDNKLQAHPSVSAAYFVCSRSAALLCRYCRLWLRGKAGGYQHQQPGRSRLPVPASQPAGYRPGRSLLGRRLSKRRYYRTL